ncbi:hypothetical protein B0H19DRAFT_1183080 [Mycena capillaripes]|nr:hypothetical protein B0H19DRAFT_1183080 [Mycena capillaripes]
MLLDLSVELLEEIGSKLPHGDHANLRAVCKVLDGAMQRLFFSVLVLTLGEHPKRDDSVPMLLDMLQALGTGKTGWSVHARTLRIQRGRRAGHQGAVALPVSEYEMKDLLASALRSVPKIRTVVWEVGEHAEQDPSQWEKCSGTICTFLNTLTSLDELQLDIQGTVDVSSLKVRGLRKFTLKNPRWESNFHFSWMTPPPKPTMYADISQLVAQNKLTALHLEGTDAWSGVWRTLRMPSDSGSQLKLTEIITNVVTPDLFDYLRSYSGIEKLKLLYPDGGSRDESDRLADTFFETILPHHATSLVELSCPASYESRFSFGTHNVDVILLLHNLKSLEMSINASAVREVDTPDVWIEVDGKEFPVDSIGISVEAEQADIDPVVTLLLETAATLPALCNLAINSAETESNRGAWCGNGRIHHTGAVDAAIEKAMQVFRSTVPCSAIVRAGNYTYVLEPLSGPDPATECHSDADPEMLGYQQRGWFSRL